VGVADLLGATPAAQDKQAELVLIRAESQFRAGKAEEALRLTEGVEQRVSGVLRARLQWLRGRALNTSSHSKEAIQLLDEALRAFRDKAEHELVARTLYDLAGVPVSCAVACSPPPMCSPMPNRGVAPSAWT
jgi:predicted Zn-dependent protease